MVVHKFFKGVNRAIKILIIIEVIVIGAWGLSNPIFALFITEQIPEANYVTVGLATAIYLLTSALLSLPWSRYLDHRKGNIDEIVSLVISYLVFAGCALLYPFITAVWQLLCVQFLLGLAMMLNAPAFNSLFTRKIDKGREGYEWTLYSSLTQLTGAGAAAVGSITALMLGFSNLFIIIAALSILGGLISLVLYVHLVREHKTEQISHVKS